MNKLLVGVMFILSASATLAQENKYVMGFGTGLMNSGLGLGVGRVFDESMLYGSTGCYGWSSTRGWVCGFGASYIKTLPWGKPKQHALQLGYNFIRERKGEGFDGEMRKEDTWVNQPTLGYLYFFDGLQEESGHIGVNLTNDGMVLNWGYQWAFN